MPLPSPPADPLPVEGGGWTATLLPEQGATLATLSWQGREVLVPLPAGADPNAAFCGAFVMAPWANRLDGGRLPVLGTAHRAAPVNRPEEDTAIHGLAREHPWRVAAAAADHARLVQHFDGATHDPPLPWHWQADLALSLGAEGALLSLAITNRAAAPFPFGLGWHPWFRRAGPGTRLTFRAAALFARDSRHLPLAAQPTTGVDGEAAEYEGLDTHFAGWDGLATILRPDLHLRLEADGAWARNLQVFAPAGSEVLCVEPVSHVPDAPNRPEVAAAHGPMTLLAPGATLAARLLLRAAEPGPGR